MNDETLSIKIRCPYCGALDMKWKDKEEIGILSFHNRKRVKVGENGMVLGALTQTSNAGWLHGYPVNCLECKKCGHMALFKGDFR